MIRLKQVSLHLFFALFLAACTMFMEANEQFIQGSWTHSEQLDIRFASYSTWTFRNGSFELQGYPPLHYTGNYRVVKSVGDTLVLELYNQKGDLAREPYELTLLLDRAGNRLSFNNGKDFHTRTK